MTDRDDGITILLVDDHALVREGLREILETQSDLRVVGEAKDSDTTMALVDETKPDIVLLDIEIPGADVTTTVKEIRNRSPRSRVIILSMYEGPQLVQALLTAGIRGYLLKSVHWQELVVAIRAIRADSDRIILGVSRESLGAGQGGRSARPGGAGAQQRPDRGSPPADGGDGEAASQEHLRQARGGVQARRRQQGEGVAPAGRRRSRAG
jgi:DNA-binding NarL/FixJ family response regulator